MRRGRLLVVGLWAAMLGAGAVSVPAAEPLSAEGLVSLASAGDGATVIVTGWMSREKFELKELRISGSRLAGKSSDPDQFRAILLDAAGRQIGVVKMWSPLLSLEWDWEGQQESAMDLAERAVEIHVPASLTLDQVIFSWPESKYEVGRVSVGDEIARFCKEMPANPACGKPQRPRG